MKKKKSWAIVLLTICCLSLWWLDNASVQAGAAPSSAGAVRVGIFPYVTTGSWPVGIAQEKGFLLQEGLNVTITETYQQIAGLVGGHFDMIVTSVEQAMLSSAKGEAVVIVGFIEKKPSQIFIVTPNIQTVKELSGKTVGVWKIPSGDMFLCEQVFAKEGVNMNSIKFVQVGGSRDRLAAITTGRIDAATFDLPHSLMARKQGMRWLNTQRYWEPMAWASILVKDEWAKKNSHVVARLVRASYRGIDWLNEPGHSEEATEILTRLSQLDRSLVEEVIKVAREGGDYVRERPTLALIKPYHEMLLKQGFLEKPLDLGKVLNTSYYDSGLKGAR